VAAPAALAAPPRPASFTYSCYSCTLAPNPVAAAIGDLDRDGSNEWVSAMGNSSLYVIQGLGIKSSVALGHVPTGVAVGDVNVDGKPDALTSSSDGSLTVLLGKGDLTFQAPVSYATPFTNVLPNLSSLALGDFNGDGAPDVVAGMGNSDNVWIFLNKGDGTFATPVELGAGADPADATEGVGVGDFNADGKLDITAVDRLGDNGSGEITILFGHGDGSFEPAGGTYGGGDFAFSAVPVDVNADGITDLVDTDTPMNRVQVSIWHPDSYTPRTFGAGPTPEALATGDVNGDGVVDLVVSNPGSKLVSFLLGNGDGSFAPPFSYGVADASTAIVVGDISGDGEPDVVSLSRGPSKVTVLQNATAGGSWSSETQVTATVGKILSVSAPASLSFPTILPGQTSTPVSAPLKVTTNDASGYQLSVSRTAFSAGDIPLSILSGAPGSGQILDLTGTTAIPTASSVQIGHRAGTFTSATGDPWATSLQLGPVPFVGSGTHQSIVTFTATGL
jgi:hypothetical protein